MGVALSAAPRKVMVSVHLLRSSIVSGSSLQCTRNPALIRLIFLPFDANATAGLSHLTSRRRLDAKTRTNKKSTPPARRQNPASRENLPPSTAAMRIANCGIHGFHETIGLDVDEVRVFWTLESEDVAQQTAYRVVLSTSQSGLNDKSSTDVAWDSGKVSSDEQRNILCKPDGGFRSTCTYYWQVTAWDQQDNATYSTVQTFFTAYPQSQLLPP